MEDIIKWVRAEIDADFNPCWGDLPCLMRPADGYYGRTDKHEIDYSKDWLRDALIEYNNQVAEIDADEREPLYLYITIKERYNNNGGGRKSIEVYLFSQDLSDEIVIKSCIVYF